MFLHESVILSTGGVCPIACWDTPPRSRHHAPGPEAGYPLAQCMLGHTHPSPAQCMLGYTPLGADTPPGTRGRYPPPQHSACWEIRATSGRYASYWNAILFHITFSRNPIKNPAKSKNLAEKTASHALGANCRGGGSEHGTPVICSYQWYFDIDKKHKSLYFLCRARIVFEFRH